MKYYIAWHNRNMSGLSPGFLHKKEGYQLNFIDYNKTYTLKDVWHFNTKANAQKHIPDSKRAYQEVLGFNNKKDLEVFIAEQKLKNI
jgi:hypothetical protein